MLLQFNMTHFVAVRYTRTSDFQEMNQANIKLFTTFQTDTEQLQKEKKKKQTTASPRTFVLKN